MVSETHENRVYDDFLAQWAPLSPLGTEKYNVKIDQFVVNLPLYGKIYKKSTIISVIS